MRKFSQFLQVCHEKVLELPTLASLILGETLMMYMSTLKLAVSADFVANRKDKQITIYFVSRVYIIRSSNWIFEYGETSIITH